MSSRIMIMIMIIIMIVIVIVIVIVACIAGGISRASAFVLVAKP